MKLLFILVISFFSCNMWGASSTCFNLFEKQIQGFDNEIYYEAKEVFSTKSQRDLLNHLTTRSNAQSLRAEEVIAFFDHLSGSRSLSFYKQMSQISKLKFQTTKSNKIRAKKRLFGKKKILIPEKLNTTEAKEFQRLAVELTQALQSHQLNVSNLFFRNNKENYSKKINEIFQNTSQNLDQILSHFSNLNGIQRALIPTKIPKKKALSLLYRGFTQMLLPLSFHNFYYKDFMIQANPIRALNLYHNYPIEMAKSIKRNAKSHWISRNASIGVYSILLALSIMPVKQGIEAIGNIYSDMPSYKAAAEKTLEQKSGSDYVNEALRKLEDPSS